MSGCVWGLWGVVEVNGHMVLLSDYLKEKGSYISM